MRRPKEQLGKLMREVGEVFTVSTTANALTISNTQAAKILARWSKQGWLTRVKRGLYVIVPLDAITAERALENAWILIPELFSPCYVGGWSAAEYWDLTEQIFNDICILSSRHHSNKAQIVHNTSFVVTKINPELIFGMKTVWVKEKKIQISDVHKTILDMLYNPQLGGGILHTIDCIKEYIKCNDCDFEKLGDYAKRMNNGAIFKRLGFIAENYLGANHFMTKLCKNNLTKGNAYLDPGLKGNILITRWNLFVPEALKELT